MNKISEQDVMDIKNMIYEYDIILLENNES